MAAPKQQIKSKNKASQLQGKSGPKQGGGGGLGAKNDEAEMRQSAVCLPGRAMRSS